MVHAKMKLIIYLVSGFITLSTYAHELEHDHAHGEDVIIEYSHELLEWCKTETEGYYVANGITPYNWSASWWEKGNTLFVKGHWLIENEHVAVGCRVAKGAKRKYAIFEFSDK